MKRILYLMGICSVCVMIFWEISRTMEGRNIVHDEEMLTEKEASYTVQKSLQTSKATEGTKDTTNGDKKIAYLSFDDGPSEVTPQILDVLENKQVPATFFLVGKEITKEREVIVRRELEEGHKVGVHTYSHEKDTVYCDEKFFFEDFWKCKSRIEEVTGQAVTLHRFPWGSNNGYVCSMVDDLLDKLENQGIRSFDWNVSGEDSVGRNVPKATIYRNVAKDIEKSNQPIILLHDSNTMKNTADVLGEIIDLLREKGYEFGTLDERDEYMFPATWR